MTITRPASTYHVREKTRTKASMPDWKRQTWTEFQLCHGSKIVGRFDTFEQADKKREELAASGGLPTKEELAERFVAVLRKWLTEDEWKEMLRRNASPEYDCTCCASHDFCDANMAMDAAFKHFGIDPMGKRWENNPAATNLWNAAWDCAAPQLRAPTVEVAS